MFEAVIAASVNLFVLIVFYAFGTKKSHLLTAQFLMLKIASFTAEIRLLYAGEKPKTIGVLEN